MASSKKIQIIGRGSFVSLFKPQSKVDAGQPDSWGMALMIPKDDAATVQKIKGILEEVRAAAFPKLTLAQLKRIPWSDGDEMADPNVREKVYPEMKGHWILNVTTKRKPRVVDQQVHPIFDESAVKSGDYFRCAVNCWSYDNKWGKGISCELMAVQLYRVGESLDGRIDPEDEFDEVVEPGDDLI